MEKTPLGIILIAYVYYFYSILSFIFGLMMMSLGIKFFQRLNIFSSKDFVLDTIEGYVFVLVWVSVLLISVLLFFFAQNIRKGNLLTRDLLLIISSLGLLVSLFIGLFLYNAILLVPLMNLFIITYLLFDKKAIKYFLK